MFRRAVAFAAFTAATLVACSQGDIAVGASSSSQELKKKSDGGATGNGATCSFAGVAYPVSATGGGTTSSDGTTTPPSDNIGVITEPSGGYPVGSVFPSPDNCHTCKCAADGIWCTTGACDSPVGTGQSPPGTGDGTGGKGCDVDGKHYAEGAQFPSSDGCNTCSCNNGLAACTERACFDGCVYGGNVYQPGDSFKSTDGCNTCSCQKGGAVACTLIACAQ